MMASPSQAAKLRNQQFVSQIFWPSHCTRLQQRCFLIGWNLENFRCCVVCAVPSEFFTLAELEELLRNLQTDPVFQQAIAPCSKNNVPPVVLGEFFPEIEKDYIPPLVYQNATIWLSMAKDNSSAGSGSSPGGSGSGARLHSIYSCGCLYKTSCYLVQYDQMDTDKLHHFSFPQNAQSDLAYTVHQTCASKEIERLITLHMDSAFALGNKKRPQQHHHRQIHHQQQQQGQRQQQHRGVEWPPASATRSPGLFTKCMMAWTYAWLSANLWARDVCDSPLGLFGARPVPMRSGSLALAHLRQRCCEIASWTLFWKQVEGSDSWDMSKRVRHWVEAYSSIASIVVDILLGIAAGLVLWAWADEVSDQMRGLWRGLQTDVLRNEIEWFTEYPMGFKLNIPLTKRLGSFVLFVTDTFSDVIWQFPKFEHFLVRAIACSGALGFTTILAAFIDVSRVLTAHITAGHRVFALLHHGQLSALTSLGYLFQGSKRNILRKRVDLCQYDRGQLILGTVIFTILFFLFPTFTAFYIFFTLLKIVTVLLQAAAWSIMIGIKEFPLLPLVLRAVDPDVMTDGVSFTIEGNFRSLGAGASTAATAPTPTTQVLPPTMKRSVSSGTPDSASWVAHRAGGGYVFPDRRFTASPLAADTGLTSRLTPTGTDLEPPPAMPLFMGRSPAGSLRELRALHRSVSTPSATDLETVALLKSPFHVSSNSPPSQQPALSLELPHIALGSHQREVPTSTLDDSPPFIDYSDGMVNIESSGEESADVSGAEANGFASTDDSDSGHAGSPYLSTIHERRSDSRIFVRDLPRRRSFSRLRSFGFPSTSAHANHVTLLRMSATPCSYLALFRRYGLYWTYWIARSPAQTLLRGAVWGRPALDIQIIRATNNLSKVRSSWEKPNHEIKATGWQMLEAWGSASDGSPNLSPSTQRHRRFLLNAIVTVYSLSLLATLFAILVYIRFCLSHVSVFGHGRL